MKYREIADGIFLDRPNRFIAHVNVNGVVETVHVKNTGRCKELLLPGAAVRLEMSDNPKRKTKYDLVAVHKQELGWVNMDSQAPNKVVGEWLSKQEFDLVRPEFPYGRSRIDFYMEKGEQKYLLEVKGCTLEVGGIGYFPDAPTERGVKHLHELAQAQRAGYRCAVAFVIQMEGITEVRPNVGTQPEFGTALAEAKAAGVSVLFLLCHVGRDSLEIVEQRAGQGSVYPDIRAARSLEHLMDNLDESFTTRLLRLIDERGLKDSTVYKRSNISRQHFSKIQCNRDYNPQKKTVLAFAVGLHLSEDETIDLLKSAGYAFSDGSKRDWIVRYCLEQKIYNINQVNTLLFQWDQELLGA